MLMLDLFSGLGGASSAFRARGWDVVTVDNDPRFGCTHTADLLTWQYDGPRPDLVWASPPCTEFSRESMPWCRTGKAPSLELAKAAKRIIDECDPAWWVIENVKGSVKWLRPILGDHRASYGPFYLWGQFPPFRAEVKPFKTRLSSSRRAERACVPAALSNALVAACEASLFFSGISGDTT